MAIRPSQVYPGQVASDPTNYPHGKARNRSVPGDGIGTPLEAIWVNDVFGFQQALLTQAGITPSDANETALVSQYLQAVQTVSRQVFDDALGDALSFTNDVSFTHNVTLGSAIDDSLEVHSTTSFVNGFTSAGPAFFDGNVTIGNASGDALTVLASTVLTGPVTVQGDIVFSAGCTPTFNDTCNFQDVDIIGNLRTFLNTTIGNTSGDALTVEAAATFNATAAFNGASVTFSASTGLTINGPSLLAAVMIASGAGRIRDRTVLGADADTDYGPATVDTVYIEESSLSGARTYTIDDTGAGNGDKMLFCNAVLSGFSVDIDAPGGSLLNNLIQGEWSIVQRISGTWREIAKGTL